MKASEWSQDYGGKVVKLGGAGNMSRTLPFDCCALSLNPFKSPICNLSGIIFDVMSILPFIKERGLSWVLPLHETVETFLAGVIFAVRLPTPQP